MPFAPHLTLKDTADWFTPLSRAANGHGRVRVVGLPYSGSGVAMFGRWRNGLGDDVDLHALALPGREQKLDETPCRDLHALADELSETLLASEMSDQPLVLVGFSLGGWLGYEIAVRMQEKNQPVALLVAAACRAPQIKVNSGGWTRGDLHTIADDEKFLHQMNRRYAAVPPAVMGDPQMRQLLTPMLRGDITMVETYRFRERPVLESEIMTLVGTEDPIIRPKHVLPWRDLTRRHRHRTFVGDHYFERTQRDAVLQTIKRRIARI